MQDLLNETKYGKQKRQETRPKLKL